MTVFEALPTDIDTALYHYCKDDECLNDAMLRALRNELKIDQVEHDKYSHDCFRCDKFKEFKNEVTAQIAALEKENSKLKETVACLREDIDVKRKDIDWYKKRGAELDSMLTDKIREVKKAKEIIKELLDLRCSVSSAKDVENRFAVREKAKRFLEEEE